MSRSIKKGPYVEGALMKRIRVRSADMPAIRAATESKERS